MLDLLLSKKSEIRYLEITILDDENEFGNFPVLLGETAFKFLEEEVRGTSEYMCYCVLTHGTVMCGRTEWSMEGYNDVCKLVLEVIDIEALQEEYIKKSTELANWYLKKHQYYTEQLERILL